MKISVIFFWNYNFENVLNFIYKTPDYGMVSNVNYSIDSSKKIKIACCKAVENIISYLSNGIIQKDQIEIVKTASTTESVLTLLKKEVDIAITNQTSFNLYKEKGIKFISQKYNVKIVWSVFKKSNNEVSNTNSIKEYKSK
jgi:bacilysin biosynthesis protein BacA